MKVKVKLMIAMVLALTLSLGCLSKGNAAEVVRVTENTYEDKNPQTANGCVVWQGEVEKGNWEIFLYNTNDGFNPVPLQVTTDEYLFDQKTQKKSYVAEARPHTDCQYITWAAPVASEVEVPFRNRTIIRIAEGLGEIFLYEIATGEIKQITTDSGLDLNPLVGNGWVVWESNVNESFEPGEILAYDIDNGVITNISETVDPNNEFDDRAPRLLDGMVYWVRTNENGKNVNFIHDLAKGKTTINEKIIPTNPQVDGDLRVFFRPPIGDNDDNDNEIFLKSNIGTIRITDNTIDDRDPYLADSFLAWVGGTGSDREIYVINFNTFDSDEDGVADVYDACPETASGDLVDPSDGCSINQK